MSDERHSTWNLWVAYGCVVTFLGACGVLVGATLLLPAWDGAGDCARVWWRLGEVNMQAYQRAHCEREGLVLPSAHAWAVVKQARPPDADEWRRRAWPGLPYDRARFCATPGLTCLD